VLVWSEVSKPPTRSVLRQFAGLLALFLAGFGVWLGARHGQVVLASVLALTGATVLAVGLTTPSVLRWPYTGLRMLTFPPGWIVGNVILAAVFYFLFTPLALAFRLAGRDVLRLRKREECQTYWEDKPGPADSRSYLHTF
jgi:hypothetical protein